MTEGIIIDNRPLVVSFRIVEDAVELDEVLDSDEFCYNGTEEMMETIKNKVYDVWMNNVKRRGYTRH